MNDDSPSGTSQSLTVDAAASVFERLLSPPENTEPARETPPEPKAPESEEPETVEVEAEADEPAEAAEEAEPNEPAPEPRKYRVKIDGEDTEVTEDELLKGYSRNADYTRKTQALAEQRKAHEAEAEAVRAERQQYAQYLQQLETAITTLTPTEPDWDTLRQQNPNEFAATWAAWQQHKERLGRVQQERATAEQRLQQDYVDSLQRQLATERDLLVEAIPEWKQPETATTEKTKMVEYAKSLGYSATELSQVMDHRALVLLRKAMMFDAAQKARPEIAKKIEKAKVAAPGPAASAKRAPTSDLTKAKQRLAKTGRVDDAANVFLQMLD